MNSRSSALIPLLALALAACGGGGPAQEPPLKGATIGGPFTLTDQNGKTVKDSDFNGRYRIVYFGYTFCPDVCPNDMARIAQAMKILDKNAPRVSQKVVPIFITVDPARDNPAALKQFVANFHPRTVGLTGSPQAIADIAKKYAVYYKAQPPATPGAGYMVDHLAVAFLMDPEGKPITSLPIDKDGAAIAEQVEHWVS